jgi:hypothetical protein
MHGSSRCHRRWASWCTASSFRPRRQSHRSGAGAGFHGCIEASTACMVTSHAQLGPRPHHLLAFSAAVWGCLVVIMDIDGLVDRSLSPGVGVDAQPTQSYSPCIGCSWLVRSWCTASTRRQLGCIGSSGHGVARADVWRPRLGGGSCQGSSIPRSGHHGAVLLLAGLGHGEGSSWSWSTASLVGARLSPTRRPAS